MNTAKKTWVAPKATLEEFTPNEYVSACIVGTIQCAYPGNGKTNGRTDEFDDYNGQESGYYRDSKGMLHGLCGYDASITFNDATGSGYERDKNGNVLTNRPIYNIKNYTPAVGTYTNVTWSSDDGDNHSGSYSHIGRLVISYVDTAHTNRS